MKEHALSGVSEFEAASKRREYNTEDTAFNLAKGIKA